MALQNGHDGGSRAAGFGGFIGTSAAMTKIYDAIEQAAPSDAPVFITGESGTGKDLAAEALHRYSRRADSPFIALNCAAIPHELMESELFGHIKGAFTGAQAARRGAVASADKGTLFLDEICEMDLILQSKLLRFLQDFKYQPVGSDKTGQADIRILCASNRDPLLEVKAGRFRPDLYYRLHVVPLCLPPLRERGRDILDLARVFLHFYARQENKVFSSFSEEAQDILLSYSWPGNVRELQNTIRHIAVLRTGPLVTAAMLPPALKDDTRIPGPLTPEMLRPLRDIEREVIEQAISLCGGNIPRAAEALKIAPSTIYRKKMEWEG